MSSDPDVPALQRFGRDLRRIREDRDVTTATVHTHTQAPESQIQSFEAGTLYEESTMNPVYLRAFVRAYAEAVDLPPHAVLDQLEAALSGNYQNQLAVQYLDVPPSASKPAPLGIQTGFLHGAAGRCVEGGRTGDHSAWLFHR